MVVVVVVVIVVVVEIVVVEFMLCLNGGGGGGGTITGMFAKLSYVDVRANRGICTAECNAYSCLKGGPGE